MISEQPGPPTEDERERVGMEFMRIAQLRFVEGYHARMAEPHPMRRNAKGDALNQREQKWSYADLAEEKCPGNGPQFASEHKSHGVVRTVEFEDDLWPAHERERWTAGFLHADSIAADRGIAAMERADPSRPPPRPKRLALAVQEDGFAELSPALTRREAREWTERHHGIARTYTDAGEQK